MASVHLPTRGLSEVIGMIAETVFINMVSDRRIVTPARATSKICENLAYRKNWWKIKKGEAP